MQQRDPFDAYVGCDGDIDRPDLDDEAGLRVRRCPQSHDTFLLGQDEDSLAGRAALFGCRIGSGGAGVEPFRRADDGHLTRRACRRAGRPGANGGIVLEQGPLVLRLHPALSEAH